jgi:eukaryotic-like serine/threonine-protein kinase
VPQVEDPLDKSKGRNGPLIGRNLAHYRITAAIGAGGMGEVYRATDTRLGREVALKVLPKAVAAEPDRLARFDREARLLASLNHPNVAQLYGFETAGAEDGTTIHLLTMELVEGEDLAERLKRGPIPLEEALAIAKQIAEALEEAHEKGIVHRDLKPANVKVTNDDAVKVLDFGLAKAVEADAAPLDISTSPTISRVATQAGVLLGTAAYMSPEQAKGKPVDRRADIWAFGCVLYEMLSGQSTFAGETVTDTLAAVIKEEPDWSRIAVGAPMRLRILLQRCLQKDPRQRLRDIGDARIVLDEVLSGTPDAALAAAPRVTGPLWRRALPWAVAALLLFALGPIAFLYLRQPPTTPPPVARLQIQLSEGMSLGGNFALSPDGRQLAFVAAGSDGVERLWIRPLDSLEARPLPGADSDSPNLPPFFWSPDSRFIAFQSSGSLEKIDVTGGPAQPLSDVHGTAVGGSWNRDGIIIFPQARGPIFRVSADGGSATPVTALDASRGDITDSYPVFLPDGRHFLYVRLAAAPHSGIYLGSLDVKPSEQPTTRLLPDTAMPVYVPSSDAAPGYVLFVRNSVLLAQPFDERHLELSGEPVVVADHVGSEGGFGFFSASRTGMLVYRNGRQEQYLQFRWFDRQGKVLGSVGEPGGYITAVLSPDGTHAAISRFGEIPTNIWLLDLLRGTSTRLTFGSSALWPVWSPDGSAIVFSSRGNLYRKLANGAKEEELILQGGEPAPTSWSRDGRFLLYSVVDPKTNADLWVLPLAGDKKPVPLLRTGFNEQEGHFSRDGRYVVYTSDESGRNEIYVCQFSSDSAGSAAELGAKWLISNSGGSEPRWRGDGKEIDYRASDGRLMTVEVVTTPAFHAGAPVALFQTPPAYGPAGLPRWDVTPDGRRFLFATPGEQAAAAPFTVVLNWQAALKE